METLVGEIIPVVTKEYEFQYRDKSALYQYFWIFWGKKPTKQKSLIFFEEDLSRRLAESPFETNRSFPSFGTQLIV